MGINNRQRRQEKQRRRDRRQAQRSQAPRGPGGARYRADELPTSDLVKYAVVAYVERDEALGRLVVAQLAARPDARRWVALLTREWLDELAKGGWEPRLAANVVRRRLSGRHAKVLLAGLAGPDDLQPGIEVLATLGSLPRLPALPQANQVDKADAKVLAKVRGLLAKAESTTFPEEAEALSAKAQELMARHAIDHALAAAGARPEAPGGRRIILEDPYFEAKSILLGAVAEANRCRAVTMEDLGHATLLGFESDLAAVEVLFTSLLIQANRAMLAAGRDDRSSRQRGFRSSFLSSYAHRIGERLEASTRAQVAGADSDQGGRLLPVLAARDDAVEDLVDSIFGGSLVSKPTRISDHRGWVAGHAAAELADLAAGPQIRAG